MNTYDVIGVGIGPSNLSTAALIKPYATQLSSIFFDDKKEFLWHPGLMFPDAKLQVSILKDLVTMLDPTSNYSFLNYLKAQNRLYIFAARNGFCNVRRAEFESYFKWVVGQLENLRFDSPVEQIQYTGKYFKVKANNEYFYTKNILMGVGLTSNIPDFCRKLLSPNLFHSSQFLKEHNNYQKKIITIIGSGQSSCEILKFLLEQPNDQLPARINWIYKNHKPDVLEDTPFANELYTPKYSDYLYMLEKQKREQIIEDQKYTSDGVSRATLDAIYELLYRTKFSTTCEVKTYNDSTLTDVQKKEDKLLLCLNNQYTLESNFVILGTGFYYKIPDCLRELSSQYQIEDGVFKIDDRYRLIPNSNINGNIFIHNGARHLRGLADPNLSLIAWRSGIIINTLFNRQVYNVSEDEVVLNWNC